MPDESVKDVKKFVMKDRGVSVRHIASEMSISFGSVETILHHRLNLFKASTRRASRMLTPDQKNHAQASFARDLKAI